MKIKDFLVSFSLSLLLFAPSVGAATEATVTATVTAQNVAVSVSDGNVTYGTLALSATRSTLPAEENEMQTATNDGNVTSDLSIKGQNSAAWTLGATQGANQYFHKFCNDTANDCSTPPTSYTALTTNYQTLATGVAASGSIDFQLQIGLPTSTSSYAQQSVDVFVQISAS